ncbi:MAG: 16S rRNA (adenine(1518)-N(6)/adenine(1519)-N(6))-dimethyltransferase RsmA [Thermomicrobiales bacterium]
MTRPLIFHRTRADWLKVLRANNIRPTRSMGQNFLVEPEVVEHIAAVSGVETGDLVVEIGPGLGILTRQLLATGARVIGVELDRELAAFLRNDLDSHPDFSLVEHDARHVDINAITGGMPYQVVANLPYSVATVVIRHFVESGNPPASLTVMVQREVAERMTAAPPAMSLLGLASQYYSDAEIAFIVPPDVFMPPPKVESAVVSMRVREEQVLDATQRDRMFELATMAFQRKRKTLANGLSQGLARDKADVEREIAAADVSPTARPQDIDVAGWIRLARVFSA